MRLDPSAILLNNEFLLNKKFYFISGNESTLIEKICDSIVKRYQKKDFRFKVELVKKKVLKDEK